MEPWDREDLDLLGPACLTWDRRGQGTRRFVAIEAGVDCRPGVRDGLPAVEFSCDGNDDGDRISGRGWAMLTAGTRRGRVFLHLRHDLDDSDDLADMPEPALTLAMVFTSVVAWATEQEPEDIVPTNVWCWRRPGRKRCRGELVADFQHGSPEIVWHRPMCGVNGVIRGGEHSLWDRRRGPA